MLTGHLSTYYYNDSESSKSSKFSNVRMIFKDAQEKGYLTTFIEGKYLNRKQVIPPFDSAI